MGTPFVSSLIERMLQTRVKREVDARAAQIRREKDEEYAQRLKALEHDIITPYRDTVQKLESEMYDLQGKVDRLSRRPTQEHLEELKRQHDQTIRELRRNFLETAQNQLNPLEEIKSLRDTTNMVVAPHENPLYMAFYLMGNADPSLFYYFLSRKHVLDYLVNCTRLRQLTMIGFPVSRQDILRLNLAFKDTRGTSIALVAWERYNVPQTRHTQLATYTPEEYLKDIRNNGITRLSSLVKQVDSGNRDSDEARLILNALRFPVPLRQGTALSLAYHLANDGTLETFEYLNELKERASYFD